MSDEDEFMSEESYEFEFEEDEDEDVVVDETEEQYSMENKYYNAKYCKVENPQKAIAELKEVFQLPQNEETIDWIFKACKQLIKIHLSLSKIDLALEYVKQLTKLVPLVNQNYAEDSVTKILNNSTSYGEPYVSRVYDIILDHLNESSSDQLPGVASVASVESVEESKTGSISGSIASSIPGSSHGSVSGPSSGTGGAKMRLWLKLNTHKLKILADEKKWSQCEELTVKIKNKLQFASDSIKNTYLFEVIATEIQITSHKTPIDLSMLNQLYKDSLKISSPVSHPKSLGVVYECGAKVQFYRGNYEKARLELYESFKNYDEAGLIDKNKILKYLALCLLLTENQFNPFESQETQSYTQLVEFSKLLELIESYQDLNLPKFKQVIADMKVSNDPLVVDDIFVHSSKIILGHLRMKIFERIVKSYKRVRMAYIAKVLEISMDELENIILQSISSGKLPSNVKIDFVGEYVEMDPLEGSVKLNILQNVTKESVMEGMRSIYYSEWRCDVQEENEIKYEPGVPLEGGQAISDLSTHQEQEEEIQEETSVASTPSSSRFANFNSIGMSTTSNPPTAVIEEKETHKKPKLSLYREKDTGSLIEIVLEYIFSRSTTANQSEVIGSWLDILKSSIPKVDTEELSQKDQVIQEQRADIGGYTKTNTMGKSQDDDIHALIHKEGINSIEVLEEWRSTIRSAIEEGNGELS